MTCDWELARQRHRELLVEKQEWCRERRELTAKVDKYKEAAILLFQKFQENLEKDPDLEPDDVESIIKGWLEQYPFLGESLFECPRCGDSTE